MTTQPQPPESVQEFPSVGKPVKGYKNKTPHAAKVGLQMTGKESMEAYKKKQEQDQQ